MNPNKTLWEKGDFTRNAATMRESGEALVESCKSEEITYADVKLRNRKREFNEKNSAIV